MWENPVFDGTNSTISACRTVCTALRILALEIPNSVDNSLFDSPDFSLNRKIPRLVKALLTGVFLTCGCTNWCKS